ncbi:hypothetical protein BDW68DRAFT_196157 [Aspergillus falconensis]
MVVHLPVGIYACILRYLLGDLYDPENDDELVEKGRQEAFKLRLVSKTVRGILDSWLYRKLWCPPDRAVEILCHTMIAQPGLGAWAEQIYVEEDQGGEHSEEEEEDDEDEAEDDPDLEIRQLARKRREVIIAAAETIKRTFQSDPSSRYSQALEKNDLNWLTRSTVKTRKWILLFQLSKLKSLTLKTHTDKFTNMALFLRLPCLEELDFAVLAPGHDGPAHAADNYAPPEDILGTIISSTSQLKSLKFEDMSGTAYQPVQHDAPRLKRILEQHAAATLTYLSICLTNNDEKDWRMEQEFSHIKGYFGSMEKFTRLQGLVMQLEVLLGRPSDGLRLRDVLPAQLQYFTGLNLPDYHGTEDTDRLWKEEDYLQQFQNLAGAAMDGRHFASLKSVKMHLDRKDHFNDTFDWPRKGQYDDGILADSRIYFGWVSGPYGWEGPGPD